MSFSEEVKAEVIEVATQALEVIYSGEKQELEREYEEMIWERYEPSFLMLASFLFQGKPTQTQVSVRCATCAQLHLMRRSLTLMGKYPLKLRRHPTCSSLTVVDPKARQRILKQMDNAFGYDAKKGAVREAMQELSGAELRSILQATLICSGSILDPNIGYSVELLATVPGWVAYLKQALEHFSIQAHYWVRNQADVVTIRGGDSVSLFLETLGAAKALLKYEEIRVERDVRNTVNRAVNCDQANAKRLVQAAQKQIQAIQFLKDHGGLEDLDEEVKRLAEFRWAHPEFSLSDLGTLFDPPLQKGAVNTRMKRLLAIAKQRQDEQERGE